MMSLRIRQASALRCTPKRLPASLRKPPGHGLLGPAFAIRLGVAHHKCRVPPLAVSRPAQEQVPDPQPSEPVIPEVLDPALDEEGAKLTDEFFNQTDEALQGSYELVDAGPVMHVAPTFYTAAATAYALVAVACLLGGGPLAGGLLLQLQWAPEALGQSMLALCAAGWLRVAALCWFLNGGSSAGQLLTWRYARVNAALMVGASVALAHTLISWQAVSVPALIIFTLLYGATAAAAGAIFVQSCRTGIWLASEAAAAERERTWDMLIWRMVADTWRDAGGMPGLLALVLFATSACYSWRLVLEPGLVVLGSFLDQDPAVQYARGIAVMGVCALALLAHSAVEGIARVRDMSPSDAVKTTLTRSMQFAAHVSSDWAFPFAERFMVLCWGIMLSAAANVWALHVAYSGLVEIGAFDALWGAAFHTTLASLAVLGALLLRLDYGEVLDVIMGVGNAASRLVNLFMSTLYYRWDWFSAQRK